MVISLDQLNHWSSMNTNILQGPVLIHYSSVLLFYNPYNFYYTTVSFTLITLPQRMNCEAKMFAADTFLFQLHTVLTIDLRHSIVI